MKDTATVWLEDSKTKFNGVGLDNAMDSMERQSVKTFSMVWLVKPVQQKYGTFGTSELYDPILLLVSLSA